MVRMKQGLGCEGGRAEEAKTKDEEQENVMEETEEVGEMEEWEG